MEEGTRENFLPVEDFKLGSLLVKPYFMFSTVISTSSYWRTKAWGKMGTSISTTSRISKFFCSAALLHNGFVATNSRAQFLSNCRSGILSSLFLLIYSLTNTIWTLTTWLDSLQLIPPHQDKGTAGQISLTEHLCLPYAWIGVSI